MRKPEPDIDVEPYYVLGCLLECAWCFFVGIFARLFWYGAELSGIEQIRFRSYTLLAVLVFGPGPFVLVWLIWRKQRYGQVQALSIEDAQLYSLPAEESLGLSAFKHPFLTCVVITLWGLLIALIITFDP